MWQKLAVWYNLLHKPLENSLQTASMVLIQENIFTDLACISLKKKKSEFRRAKKYMFRTLETGS